MDMIKNKRLIASAITSAVLCVCMIAASAVPAEAAVRYLTNVTSDMSKASYWSDKMLEPDKVLAGQSDIDTVNEEIARDTGTNVQDLTKWSAETFNGKAMAESLKNGARADAEYFYSPSCWARYAANGDYLATWDEAYDRLYGPAIENCYDQDASEEMPVQYGICTTRTCIRVFPADIKLVDDPADPDFDYLYNGTIRVNEPVIVQAHSNDDAYYHVTTSNLSGWVPVEDIAVCADKTEWLGAWDLNPADTLVVYDDKIRTEESNFAPEASNRMLSMGTCLELATGEEAQQLINNHSAHNNHTVWMPVRKANGSYEKKLALIPENRKVSEGFLPLTSANIAMVAMNQLGDAYGWGGMLSSNDCSAYVRDVYKCFGLELARNTTWQANQPVKKYEFVEKDASGNITYSMPTEERRALIKSLPVGSVLIFSGHEMIYLGYDKTADRLYVISNVSKLVDPNISSSAVRIRNTVINTLEDTKRATGVTWLDSLTTAEVPYLASDAGDDFGVGISMSRYASAVTLSRTSYVYSGKEKRPAVTIDGLDPSDYTVSYKANIKAGKATVIMTGNDIYKGSIKKTFTIRKAANTLEVKPVNKTVRYSKLKKKDQTVEGTVKASKAKGKKTYKKSSGNARIKVDSKTGKLTVKKGLKKGTYKVKIKVTAAGDSNYKSSSKTVTAKVTVK